MLQWLVRYGVDRQRSFEIEFQELDIHDKLALERQINDMRRNCHQLLSLMDEIQGKLVDVKRRIALHVKDVTVQVNLHGGKINQELNQDDKYVELEAERDALSAGLSLVQNELDQCRSDLRILNSAMYQKF